ncbi:MAG: tetratricopeptide repeat protein [Candidatus Hodarchaeales archaeon]|jgi:tetratricopeptide (TPR) repeat protein
MTKQLLDKANDLVYVGHFVEAFDELEKIRNPEQLSPEERLLHLLLQSSILRKIGKYSKAQIIAEQLRLESKNSGNILREIDAINELILCLTVLEQYKQGLELVDNIIAKFHNLTSNDNQPPWETRHATFLFNQGFLLYQTRKFDEALECITNSYLMRKELNEQMDLAKSLRIMGELLSRVSSEFEQGLNYCQDSLKIVETIGNHQEIAYSLESISVVFELKFQINEALDYAKKALSIHRSINNDYDIARLIYQIGKLYWQEGQLNNALTYYQESLSIYEKINHQYGIAKSLNGIGTTYTLQGELKSALEFFQRSITIYEKIENAYGITIGLGNIAEIYDDMNENKLSIDYFKRALDMSSTINNDLIAAEQIYQLIRRHRLDIDPEKIKSYLDELYLMTLRQQNPVITQQYKIAKALILNEKNRLSDRFMALKLFREIVNEKIVKFELTVTAMVYLSQLLLFELELSNNHSVLSDIVDLLTRLMNIAKSQKSNWLIVEAYLIQTKLALVELDIDRAQHYIRKAQEVVNEKNLSKLANVVSAEQDVLIMQLHNWEKFIASKPSMKEKIQFTRIEELIERMTTKKQYNNEIELVKYVQSARKAIELMKTSSE